jgi:hypothetical protein
MNPVSYLRFAQTCAEELQLSRVLLAKHFAFIVEYSIWCNGTERQEPLARQ